MDKLELTLAILKPHVIKNPIALSTIRKTILESNFKIVNSKRYALTKTDAEKFYNEHKRKFFYNRGPSEIYIMARKGAIWHWRKLMGPTKVYVAQFSEPHSIRGELGLSDTRNAVHGSDSPESVKREIGVFYPNFDVERWYEKEAVYYERDEVIFDEEHFIHRIKRA